MTNILLKYLENRYEKEKPSIKKKTPGPVITISREFGCPANMCANGLADLLNKIKDINSPQWKVVSKEILDQAAEELGLSPDKIDFVFSFEKRNAVDEILESLSSKYYKSERKIRSTIKDVIRSIGQQGFVIIVGRGGAAILKDIEKSMHIRLIAPLDYRGDGVSRRHEISKEEAKKLTLEMDRKRKQLRDDFSDTPIDNNDYDLIFNCKKLSTESIVDLMAKAANLQGVI